MEQILHDAQSTYYLLEPDTVALPPEFESIYKLWQSKRIDGLFPCWKDFDFTDFIGWHGMLILSETHWDPFKITYRIFGSEIANIIGEDLTGKTSEPGKEGGFYYTLDKPYLEAIVQQKKLGYAIGLFDKKGTVFRKIAYMDFPMNRTHHSKEFESPTTFLTACYCHKTEDRDYLSAPLTLEE